MAFRFTKPQAELYQAVLDIQKSCLSLCSPGVSLENIYSLMLSLIGQKLKELGVLKSSITDNHFFKVLQVFLLKVYFTPASSPLGLTVFSLGYVSGFSLAQECAFEINHLIVPTHYAFIHVAGWSQHRIGFLTDKAKLEGVFQPFSAQFSLK